MRSIALRLCLTFIGITLVMFSGSGALAAEKTSDTRFNTLSKKDSFSFVVWGHPRGEANGKLSLYFEEVIDRIAELNPDFLIITGDMIFGMSSDLEAVRVDWEKFDAGVNRLGIPVYRLPGNHDVHDKVTRNIYLERYPNLPYAFTFKGNRFILLDTMRIEQYSEDGKAIWRGNIQPFSDAQLNFIRNEVGQQENYNHIFFFMHHPHPWSDPPGFWWRDVHPFLRGGKTRAVFAGSPWIFKYAHLEQDGIHYILSSCTNDPDLSKLRRNPNPDEFALQKQLNNLQYIRVNGDKYTIQTIVIGALSSKALNWGFWDQLKERQSSWGRYLTFLFHMKFYQFHKLVLVESIWGGLCFLIGVLLTVLWMRHRARKKI